MANSGPAFPITREHVEAMHQDWHGMSLRDYFAAAALQGICAYPQGREGYEEMARWAYQAADAMLEARK
jgi:hypothetical protein